MPIHQILQLEKFGIRFGSRIVLTDVNLDVAERGITVVVGPVAAGKSTLVRALAGQFDDLPGVGFSGSAMFMGDPLREAPERPVLVSQGARLVVASVLEGVLSVLPERGQLAPPDSRALVELLLRRSQLEDLIPRMDEPVSELSTPLQRRLSILRSAASNPRVLCVDEPTAEIEDEDALPILEQLIEESRRRAVVVITHNQDHAKYLDGRTVLLAGGTIRAESDTRTFFSLPSSETSKIFVRTGSCATPSPNTSVEELDETYVVKALHKPTRKVPKRQEKKTRDTETDAGSRVRSAPSEWLGPRGFHWMEPGQLGGTPLPGLLRPVTSDLKALERVGVTALITLTESPLQDAPLDDYGIRALHFPVVDMQAPSLDGGVELCERINELMHGGHCVAVHCKAGLGRTGTALAAWLIYGGESADNAITRARTVEPRWIQSEAQIEFLKAFEQHCSARQPQAARH